MTGWWGKRLLNGVYKSVALQQWQPTLTAHDPNPPITLEDAIVPPIGGALLRMVMGMGQ